MIDRSQLYEMIRQLCASQKFAVLATQSDDLQPYCNFIAFSASADLAQLFFVTPRHTRKFRNLKKNNRVSLLLDSRLNTAEDFESAVVATAIGSAEEVSDVQEDSLRDRHIKKHPSIEALIRSPDCALFRIDVQKYIIASSFEKVSELEMV
jgi:nitroimidazol reductase NimA-like FMN-containing flavoprotein (pyridoxamine 5'-phosphate oxidase superfamily)